MAIVQPNTTRLALRTAPPRVAPKNFHTFSRELAREINPTQPDIAAALVHHTLYTWQSSHRYAKKAFRSIRKLENDIPYLSRSVIHDAIRRLEDKGFLTVDRTKKELEYNIPEEAIERFKYASRSRKRNHLWVMIEHAGSHGLLESVILGNLSWMMMYFKHPHAMDEQGRRYYKLHPDELAKHLPRGTKAIRRALKRLQGVIVEHPTKKWHYRYVSNPDSDQPNPDENGSDPDTIRTDRDTATELSAPRGLSEAAPETFEHPLDSNIDSNVDRKVGCKVNYQDEAPPTAHARLEEKTSSLSEGLQYLKNEVDALPKHYKPLTPLEEVVRAQEEVILNYTGKHGTYDADELPYDFIPRNADGSVQSWDEEMDTILDGWRAEWSHFGFPFTEDEIQRLRQILDDNRQIDPQDIYEIIGGLDCFPQLVIGDDKPNPKKWNSGYFHEKVKNLGAFIRYMPQVIQESFNCDRSWEEFEGLGYTVYQRQNEVPREFRYLLEYLETKRTEGPKNSFGE